MKSLISGSHLPLSFSPNRPPKPYASPSTVAFPNISARFSSSSSSSSSSRNPPPTHKLVVSSIKPVVVTLVAVSATVASLLSGRAGTVAPSSGVAYAAEEPLPDDGSTSSRIESLQAEMEAKVKAGNLADAVRVMDKMILLQPDDNDLLLLKAHLHTHQGNHALAKGVFEEVLRKDPASVEAYHGLVLIAAQTDNADGGELDRIMERVEDALEACRKENRTDGVRDFMLLIAQFSVMVEDYDRALEICTELVSDDPSDFRPYLCQGIVYTLLRKKDEADKQFDNYRRLVPKEHPYAQYFEENMALMKAVGRKQDDKSTAVLKS